MQNKKIKIKLKNVKKTVLPAAVSR